MVNGKIVKSGKKELAQQIEKDGYESIGRSKAENE
jgi:Fe-S cluster assembly ATPase SufC